MIALEKTPISKLDALIREARLKQLEIDIQIANLEYERLPEGMDKHYAESYLISLKKQVIELQRT